MSTRSRRADASTSTVYGGDRPGCGESCPGRFNSSRESGSARSGRATTSSSCKRSLKRSSTRMPRQLLGLSPGQITLQYHGGGGSLTGELGLLFGRRKRKPARQVRVQMAVQRPLYHFGQRAVAGDSCGAGAPTTSAGCACRRPLTGAEGERWLLANAMAMNYGFAFRLATLREPAARCSAPASAPAARLVVDSPHNSIYDEEVDGEHGAGAPAQRLPRLSRRHTMRDHPVVRADRPAAARARHATAPRRTCASPGEHADRACTPPATAPARSSATSREAGRRRSIRTAARRCASTVAADTPKRCRTSTTTQWTRSWASSETMASHSLSFASDPSPFRTEEPD